MPTRRALSAALVCLAVLATPVSRPVAAQDPRGAPPPISPPASTSQPAQDAQPAVRRAVLVTGASSGIGRKTTELLAQHGFFVFAGARKPEDLEALGKLANVQAVPLDVTVQGQVDEAVATVRAAGRGLFAVINNAGIAVLGPLLELDED
jgi:NADPH:quinone reductase-like Zn-dependent oxidoreductase